MTDRNKIPGDDLAADAALAVEHTPEREAEQRAYYGGDVDEVDDFDPTGLDDGSSLDGSNVPPPEEEEEEKEEEPEEEKEEEEEEPEEEEEEPEEKPAPKGIPKHRFDEVNQRRKAAEEENARLKAELEAGKPPAEKEAPYDFDAAEKEYIDLTLDGDVDGALAKRKEIRAAEHAEWKSETMTETKSTLSADAEQAELISLSKEAEAMFGQFDPEHEDFDQGMLNKVLTFMRGYETEMSRTDAFIAGLADVVELYDLTVPGEEGDADPAPKPTGKRKTDPKKAKLREKAHQPVGGEGSGSSDTGAVVPNIEDMTDEELEALPAKALARLRGDFV